MLSATPIYAALCGVFVCFMAMQVIRQRVRHKISLLDGGVSIVARHIRAHGNFTEYAPLFLVLLLIAELQHAPLLLLHVVGIMFMLGRVTHYVSLTRIELQGSEAGELNIKYRQIGMVLTFIAFIVVSLAAMF